jgi:hypothetical protein
LAAQVFPPGINNFPIDVGTIDERLFTMIPNECHQVTFLSGSNDLFDWFV